MKLREGYKYVRRDGSVSGRIAHYTNPNYPFTDPASLLTYQGDGRQYLESCSEQDLIELYIEETEPVQIEDPKWLTSLKDTIGKTVRWISHSSTGLRVIYFETNEVLVTMTDRMTGNGEDYISTVVVPKPAIPSSAPKPLLRRFKTHIAYLTELMELELIPDDSIEKQEEFDEQQTQDAELTLLANLKAKYEGDYKC